MHSQSIALPHELDSLAEGLQNVGSGIMLVGEMGSGKSTLAAGLAARLSRAGRNVLCLSADPGTPAFGVPGAACLAQWLETGWRCTALQPLCSLDAVRFRLPLAQAVTRLSRQLVDAFLIVDAPGVVRGVVGAETLLGLAEAADTDTALVLDRPGGCVAVGAALEAIGCQVIRVRACADAVRPCAGERARLRTVLWDRALSVSGSFTVRLDQVRVLGLVPSRSQRGTWLGRQVALRSGTGPWTMGEVVQERCGLLTLRLVAGQRCLSEVGSLTLLVRDARRDSGGMLVTDTARASPGGPVSGGAGGQQARHGGAAAGAAVPLRSAGGRALCASAGGLSLELANGVFGDALLRVTVRGRARRLLFDLGDVATLSRRALNTVSDVFISHAHLDHICGLLGFLRARIGGCVPPCRIFGPPGIVRHVSACFAGVCWDRIEDSGPVFEVAEVYPDHLAWHRLQPGQPQQRLPAQLVTDGRLLDEPAMQVRAVALDHGITVLSYAVELPGRCNVSARALSAMGLSPGPWLGELKRLHESGRGQTRVLLPNAVAERADALAAKLLRRTAPTRLVYATDLADTPGNRATLLEHAHAADLLVCEAAFRRADMRQAIATGHLTTTACGQIAAQAQVKRLLPCHFSKRYTESLTAVYSEIDKASGGIEMITAQQR